MVETFAISPNEQGNYVTSEQSGSGNVQSPLFYPEACVDGIESHDTYNTIQKLLPLSRLGEKHTLYLTNYQKKPQYTPNPIDRVAKPPLNEAS